MMAIVDFDWLLTVSLVFLTRCQWEDDSRCAEASPGVFCVHFFDRYDERVHHRLPPCAQSRR